MATYSKNDLSGSTTGRGILVAATATLGTTIHTAVTGTDNFDEIWLWAINNHTADLLLTIEWGGVTSPNDLIVLTVPTQGGLIQVAPGLLLQNALVATAFAASANLISIHGFVNEIVA